MHLQAPHCASCGAPIDVPVGAQRVTCAFCQTTLVVQAHAVSTFQARPRVAAAQSKAPPFPEPDATLRNWAVPRFELSLVEQVIPNAVPEVFAGFELPSERFAFVSLRVVDAEGQPQPVPLTRAFEALRESLANDLDPGDRKSVV
jgi:LSD1 subclass zinc finger protein